MTGGEVRAKLIALAREASKFGVVGGISFTLDLIIFNVLLGQGMETLAAKTVSTSLTTLVAFAGNRFWTWRDRAHTNMGRQYTMFFLLNAVGLGIGLACLGISHYGLGQLHPFFRTQLADNIAGQLVGTALGTLFRFWSYRRFVFRAPTTEAAEPRLPDVTSPTP